MATTNQFEGIFYFLLKCLIIMI